MITIEHLEIRFDVDADDEDVAFMRQFQKCIGQWQRRRQLRLDGDMEGLIGAEDSEESIP